MAMDASIQDPLLAGAGGESPRPARRCFGCGRTRRKAAAPLSTAGLVALTFFSVTGGPFGQELIVRAGGPLVAIVSYVAMTLVWSVPEALMTAELSSAFPEAAGFAAWSSAAFGPTAGWAGAWCSWVSGVVDNAVYPLFVLEYVGRATPLFDDSAAYRWCFAVGFVGALTYVVHRGLDLTGSAAVVLAAVVLAPFGVFSALAIRRLRPGRWAAARPLGAIRYRALVNNLFWNVNYFDSASAWAGETDRASWGVAMVSSVALYDGNKLLKIPSTRVLSERIPSFFSVVENSGSEDQLFKNHGKRV